MGSADHRPAPGEPLSPLRRRDPGGFRDGRPDGGFLRHRPGGAPADLCRPLPCAAVQSEKRTHLSESGQGGAADPETDGAFRGSGGDRDRRAAPERGALLHGAEGEGVPLPPGLLCGGEVHCLPGGADAPEPVFRDPGRGCHDRPGGKGKRHPI